MVLPIPGLLGNRHVSHHFVLKCNDALKAHSHDPILRIRFLVPKIGSRCSDGPLSRFCFCGENVGRSLVVIRFSELTECLQLAPKRSQDVIQNLSAPFILQEECWMKIAHALFPFRFFQNYGSMCRKVIFNVFTTEQTKIGSLKADRVNGP